MKLKSGIHLKVQNCQQFKTTLIVIRFETEIREEVLAKRALISTLLEKNNAKYPENQKFKQKLAETYGANFEVSIEKKGQTHCLSLNFRVVNGKFVNDKDLLIESIDLLKTIIFQPNIKNNAFDEKTFQIEKKNLIQYAKSAFEDNRYYAQNQLKQLYFDQPVYALPTFSSVELIEKETAKSVYDYYQKMINEDLIEILVVGDVDDDEMIEQFEKFPFPKRASKKMNLLLNQSPRELIREKTEQRQANQSILNIGYYIPADISQRDYFPLLVFNGLLGGFSHSKLFMNIREQASLAYDISSSVDVLRHLLMIETGIPKNERTNVLKLIYQQFNELKLGQFSKEEVNQTILMLKNSYLQGADSQKVLLERLYLTRKIPEILTEKQWIAALELVDKADIIRIANSAKLQTIYFMEGQNSE